VTTHRTIPALLACAAAVAAVSGASARSLWVAPDGLTPKGSRTLIADPVARQVGDVVTILISETTQAGNQASHETSQDSGSALSAGQGLLSFIPFFSLGAEDSYGFEGAQSWQGTFVARMSAVVKEVMPGALLVIEGTRSVDVNGEKQELTLTGTVRAMDISRANTISSQQIADAKIRYKGAGPMGQKAKPGILTRLLDFLF